MNILDLLLLVICMAGIYFFIQNRKKKKAGEIPPDTLPGMSNYAALRGIQAENAPLHGISIVSLYYDSVASYANMEGDGTNTNFDLSCEAKVNDVLKSLKADGYAPTINALSCVDRVIFCITY